MNNSIRLAAPLQTESVVDGKGIRMVVWNQGCKINCPGCHNPETHDCNGGYEVSLKDLLEEIKINAFRHSGVTLSGGDPFLQPEVNKVIAEYVHSLGLNVWAYCGETFEKIIQDKNKKQLLENCDILIDGPFILALRDTRLAFRGSSNQRIIKVKESLQQDKIILLEDLNG